MNIFEDGDLSLRPRPGESAEDVLARVERELHRQREARNALDPMRKGNALAVIDQLARALAFPEDGALGYRLAALQLVATDRDALVAALEEHLELQGERIVSAEEIVDLIIARIGR